MLRDRENNYNTPKHMFQQPSLLEKNKKYKVRKTADLFQSSKNKFTAEFTVPPSDKPTTEIR